MDQLGADLVFGTRLPRAVRAVVFDLDGTLIDTERAYRAAFLETVAAFGRTLPEGAYEGLVGLPTTTRRRLLPSLLGTDCPVDRFVASYYSARARHLAGGIALKPGAAELLARLHVQSMPMAIATSASAITASRHLSASGLASHFQIVISRDDVARGKPAPDSFALAALLLGVPSDDCLAVEDSAHGVTAAHAAGLMVVMVPDLVAPTPEARQCCVSVLASLQDVARLLETAPENDRSRFRV